MFQKGEIVEHISLPAALIAVVVVGALVARWVANEVKIRRLGGHAPRIRSTLPLGMGVVFQVLHNSYHKRNLRSWQSWIDGTKNGGTVEATILNQRCIFTADPENIKAILATQFQDYGKGKPFYDTWKQFLGDSIFTTDGDMWHGSRQLIRPMFLKERVSDLEVMERHVQTLLSTIVTETVGGEVDISDLIFRYTLNVATDFLLGESVGSLENPRSEFEEAFSHVQHVQGLIARAGPAHAIIPRKSFYENIKSMNKFIQPYIDSALGLKPSQLAEKGETGYTFLHALASFTRDPKMIRDQLASILIAGRDTTAGAMSWTFFELARHPEVVEKLRKEILDSVGLEPPTYNDLKDMKYLQNVMRETLRLYPIIPFNMRLALKDNQLPRGGGPDGKSPIGVLKDTPISYSPLFLHRRAELYPPGTNYLEFSPERWETWQPKAWAYIPFNGGPRICIGQQFALTEMGYTIVRLLQRFERVEDRMGGEPAVMECNISVRPANGVRVKMCEAQVGAKLDEKEKVGV